METLFKHNGELSRRIIMAYDKAQGYIVTDQAYEGLRDNKPYWRNLFIQADKLQHVAKALYCGRVVHAAMSNGNA